MTESKKSKAYRLFSEGKEARSPEVKALKLTKATRYNYFSAWKREGKPDHIPLRERGVAGGTVAAGETMLGGGEAVGGYAEPGTPVKVEAAPVRETIELAEDEEEFEAMGEAAILEGPLEEPPGEGKSKIELGLDGNDKDISADVVGFGLPVRVSLSIKTLALYQIAASRSDDGLTLGDFLDLVAEDYFQGRGKDLGLMELSNG